VEIKVEIKAGVLDQFADALAKAGYLSTRASIETVVREIVAQAGAGKGRFDTDGREKFSISKALRGLAADQGKPITNETREADVEYAHKSLLTGTTPGSFLIPAIQANEIIQLLASAHKVREGGARIWPMPGVQKMNVPVETAAPTVVWGTSSGAGAGGQGVTLTPSDPNIAQVAFDLKSAKSLTAIPNELLAASVPAIDQIVAELLALGFGQAEMNAYVAGVNTPNGPPSVYNAAGVTRINSNGGSANGGAIKFNDLLGVAGAFYAAKGNGEPAWFMHPTVFYKDIMGLSDTNGRPIVTGFDSLEGPFQGRLFGFKVWISAEFPTNLAIGSGSSQSYLLFTNPKYLHIADRGGLEIQVSMERFFDSNQTGVRGVHQIDHAFAPAAAIVILDGCNV
jgi:HK97 family phage major capsid protein